MRYFYKIMYKYETYIILTSNIHHNREKVVLSPEFMVRVSGQVWRCGNSVKDLINLTKKCTAELFSFSVDDNTLVLDNPLNFRQNILERI